MEIGEKVGAGIVLFVVDVAKRSCGKSSIRTSTSRAESHHPRKRRAGRWSARSKEESFLPVIKMKKLNQILWALVACMLSSCGMMRDQYDVVLTNEGSEKLDKAYVSYGDFKSVGGILSPGVSSTHSFADEEEAIPEEAKAEWKRVRDGKKFEKMVKVKSKLPKGRFKGDIIFLFNDDDVELTWEKE